MGNYHFLNIVVGQSGAVDTTASFVIVGYDLSDIAVVAATKVTASTNLFMNQQAVVLVIEIATG